MLLTEFVLVRARLLAVMRHVGDRTLFCGRDIAKSPAHGMFLAAGMRHGTEP